LLRAGLWLATSSLTSVTLVPALAQPAPPPGDEQASDGQAGDGQAGDPGTEPPALAGRLASLAGEVSFHAAGETQWSPATLNYPVTNGEAFWTQPQATATIEIADDAVVLDAATELDVTSLDQSQFVASLPQGALFLQLNSLPAGQSVTVTTPRGAVQISATGRYEIAAGDTDDATTITVVEGAAHVAGTDLSLDIGPQQTATIDGTTSLQGSVGPMRQDAFLQAQLSAPPPRRSLAVVPQQVQYMTGAQDLQAYGSWSDSEEYGAVWYPNNVGGDWAPYREGAWSYVQPWGWTWVDREPWGFAPFHYGRWIRLHDRWGWVAGGAGPAYAAYPVYAPALVSFVDVGAAALAGFAAGELAGGYAPAWIPLGPREPYYPWYHTRGDYFARINRPYGVPPEIIRRGPTFITNVTTNRTQIFINRGAATVVPAAIFARGEPVARFARPLPERALAEARPVFGRLPVRPTAFTPNLPLPAARRFGVALPPHPVRPTAPGPRIEEAALHGAPALRNAAPPRNLHAAPPALAPGAREAVGPGPAPRTSGPGMPAMHMPQPRTGLPPLRSPGARPEDMAPGAERLNPASREERGGEARPPGRSALPMVHQPSAPVMPRGRPEPSPERSRPTERPAEAGRPEIGRPEDRGAPRPSPAREEERAAPHADRLPRIQEPHIAPHHEIARQAPHPEAAPREAMAPRPAPHPAAPRPSPHPQARPEPR
jgi:hypothetical protein